MIRMGLRLTLRNGREGFARLAITTAAIAVGVALLLGVLAEFHAFQSNANQPCWSCTTGNSIPSTLPDSGELWNNSVDFYQGQTITRLDVASLGSSAPVLPGISRLPGPGQYYASPALEALIRSVPADELGDRFPGHFAGTIGDAALNGSGDLVIYVGYTSSAVNAIPGSVWVTSISTAPAAEVFTPFFRYVFGVGVLAVLLPMLVLIGTATRLAAARREERFAALRLVGATPRDVTVIAAVEASVSALAGAALGTVIFLLLRPVLASTAPIGVGYFASTVTPTLAGYVAILVGVPVVAAIAALLSLRRVSISPLGAARRAKPRPPTVWRLTTLVIGVGLYFAGLAQTTHNGINALTYVGLLLTMIGLVIAGPWLTWASAWLTGLLARGTSSLLAARRLTDNPKVASRAVTGLVLAVFLGTMVGALMPAVESFDNTPNSAALANVLVYQVGLSPTAGAKLVSGINGISGTAVYPIYTQVTAQTGPLKVGKGHKQSVHLGGGQPPQYLAVISCGSMRGLRVLGQCAPGVTAVQTNDNTLFSDNPYYTTQAFVTSANPAYTGKLSTLYLQAVLVRVNNAVTLERVRTYLAVNAPPAVSPGQGASATPPRTFAETSAIRDARSETVEKLVYAAVALTLVVAGCSLAVAVGGGLVDRKRPFTLLRVTGTPVSALSRVVLLEAVIPLVAVVVIAGGIAYGSSVLAYARLAPAGSAIPRLGASYWELMGTGIAAAILVICATLPLMRRMTAPSGVRFE
ncbi:MAG: FtsX-like permease family protein [Streptosporangiaceae bacterium]|jgi:hypothetical protein